MAKYLVFSPERMRYFGDPALALDPPEPYCEAAEVTAENKREAKVKALRTPDFRSWIVECRGDNRNPFAGLSVVQLGDGEGWGDANDR